MTDLAVLGAGSAGYSAALRAARLGLDVTLIDPGPLGGTCLHAGCVPTKAWLHAATVRRTVRSAEAFGITGGSGEVDARAVRRHADEVIVGLHRGLQALVTGAGIRAISAAARLRSATEVETAGERIQAKGIIVATGAQPLTLGLPTDGHTILTSDDALRLTTLPERAVIVGGGVIGVEFASMWCDLGVEVTLVEAAGRLLPSEDPALSKILTRALSSRGVRVLTGIGFSPARSTGQAVEVVVGDETLRADALLVAAGRRPRTAGLGLEVAGVEMDGQHIVVDEDLRTSQPTVWAIGDVVAGPQLAHRGYAHGIHAAEMLAWQLGRGPKPQPLPKDHNIPRITYSAPQVASVGLTCEQAGKAARAVTYHLAGNARSLIARPAAERESGIVQVVADEAGVIVGVHAVGEDVAELITAGALHVGWRAEPDDVARIVHPHPSVGESLAEAIAALGGRPLHMRA